MEVKKQNLDAEVAIIIGTMAAGKGVVCVVVGVVSEVHSQPKRHWLIDTVALFRIRPAY